MMRVGRVMAAALVAVPLFVAVGPAVSSAAPIGDVSGTMVDTSLQPLAGEVSLVDGDGTVVYDSPVAADGLFSFTGVEEGSYSLRASTGGKLRSEYPVPVTVSVGSPSVTGLQLVAADFASVTGTVTDVDGNPVGGGYVSLGFDPRPGWVAYGATADANGVFTFTDVAPGMYKVQAAVPFPGGPWWHPYGVSIDQAQYVSVGGGSTVTGVDVTAGPGTISGTVTVGGQPLEGATLTAQSACPGSSSGVATSAADGTYTVRGLTPGCYTVRVEAPGFPGRIIGGDPALVVSVTAGALDVDGIDFDHPSGRIAGTVTWRGAPLAGALVLASRLGETLSVTADANGEFDLRGLVEAQWHLAVSDPAIGSASGPSVTVTAGQPVVTGVALDVPPGRISGTVFAHDGSPVTSGYVDAYDSMGTWITNGFLGDGGAFVVGGLPEGTISLRVRRMGSAITTPFGPYAIAAGTYDVTGLVLTLPPPGALTGVLRDASGAPIAGVPVWIESDSFSRSTTSGVDGSYAFDDVPSDPLRVYAQLPSGDNLYHPSTYDYWQAVRVTVAPGTTAVADLTVPGPSGISGRVTDSGGAGIAGVTVSLYQSIWFPTSSTTTDAQGDYSFPVVTPGTYYIWFNGSPAGYRSEWFDDAATVSGAVPVTIGDGEARIVDEDLELSSSVSGQVRNTAGDPVAAQVTLYPVGGPLTSAYGVDPSGNFSFVDLAPGDYYLYVTPYDFFPDPPSEYAPEYYGGSYDEAGATVIHVTEGMHGTGFDVVVDIGATVTGTVRRASNGATVGGVTIEVRRSGVPEGFGWWVQPVTDGAGRYTIVGLPPTDVTITAHPSAETGLGQASVVVTTSAGAASTAPDLLVSRGVYATVTLRDATGAVVTPGFGVTATACLAPQVVVGQTTCTSLVTGTANPDGTVTLGPLSPGTAYNLQAINYFSGVASAPLTLTPAASVALTCALYYGGPTPSSCTSTPLDPTTTVTGRVVGPEGTGIEGAQVALLTSASTVVPTAVTTDSLGYYEMPDVPTGTYRVRVSPPAARTDLITEYRSTGEQAYSYAEGDALAVTAGTPVTGVNLRLDKAASGTATVYDDGTVVTGIGVGAFVCRHPATWVVGFSCSDGSSAIGGLSALAPGEYELVPINYFAGVYGPKYTLSVASGDTFDCSLQLRSTLTTGSPSSCTVTPAPLDTDGVSETVENGAPNNGDGNADGTPDSEQPDVTSVQDPATNEYVTLEIEGANGQPSGYVLSDVRLVQPPQDAPALPADVTAQSAMVGFTVDGLPSSGTGETVTLRLWLPAQADAYFKWDERANAWIDATSLAEFDALPTTIGGEVRWGVTLTLTDGVLPGDQDGTVNGSILDPGVFALLADEPADETPPTITCPAGASFVLNDPQAVIVATVTDEVGGSGVPSSTVSVPVTAVRGGGAVTVTAADNAGNSASVPCGYTVTVRYQAFTSPVSPTQTNKVQAGQNVPLKWRLVDALGQPVADAGWYAGVRISGAACDSTAGSVVIETTATGTTAALQYNGDGWWQVNWKTPKTWNTPCLYAAVQLAGGGGPSALFMRR